VSRLVSLAHHFVHKENQRDSLAAMSIQVRAAFEEDFLAMCKLDVAANATHPVYVIPWTPASPTVLEAFVLGRYKHLYHSRNPEYFFLVATAGDEIVGYLIYQKPPGAGEQEEWNPDFPDGTNLEFFEKVFGEFKVLRLKRGWLSDRD
jgi:hypothetical protein